MPRASAHNGTAPGTRKTVRGRGTSRTCRTIMYKRIFIQIIRIIQSRPGAGPTRVRGRVSISFARLCVCACITIVYPLCTYVHNIRVTRVYDNNIIHSYYRRHLRRSFPSYHRWSSRLFLSHSHSPLARTPYPCNKYISRSLGWSPPSSCYIGAHLFRHHYY